MPLRAGATNEILPFATDVAAPNVIDQEEYARLPARREGFTKGLARSANMNKVWRQSAHMAAALAQFVANHYPPGVRDDGNLDVVELGLMAALAAGLVWSEDVDYTVPCVVIGHNNKLYVALAPSGPNTVNGGQTVGAKTPADPANAAYWKTVMPNTDGTTIEERDDVLTVLAAPKLSTPRNITLSGGATGSASFDGSADAAINVTGLDVGKANAGTLPVGRGGTGAATAAQALTSLGAASSAVTITAGAGLSGGGNLTANRTLAVKYGTTAGTACQGNDARLTNARTPAAHKATHKTGGTDALTPADIGAASSAVTITAGNGLTGGGQLTGNVTLAAKLLDSVASTDTTSAGTANAVKVAYDTAVNALNVASSAQTVVGARAPMPQQAAGVGQWIPIVSASDRVILPSGGGVAVCNISVKQKWGAAC